MDIWRLWAEKTGRKIAFRLMPWAETIKGLKQGEVDIHSGLFEAENRAEWIRFSQPIYGVGIRAYFPVKKGIISSIRELAGQKVGVTKGSHIETYVRDRYPEVGVAALRSTEEAVYAAREGTIAAFVGVDPVVSAILTRLGLQGEFESTPEPLYTRTFHAGVLKENAELFSAINKGLALQYVYYNHPFKGGMAIRSDWPELVPILNKGISSFSENEIDAIVAKWVHLPQQKDIIALMPEEHAWLKAHPGIRIGLPEELESYVMTDQQGNQTGILVDFKDELNRTLGTNLILKTMPTSKIFEMSKKREIDTIYAVEPYKAEQEDLLQTDVWAIGYPAIYVRQGFFFKTPDDMVGETVVLRPNMAWDNKIVQPYEKSVKIVYAETPLDAMKMILNEDADIYLGLTSHKYVITKYRLFGIASVSHGAASAWRSRFFSRVYLLFSE